jgi:hypothetical protein
MEIFDNTLMAIALGGLAVSLALFASALLYPHLRKAWNKATALARAVFCGAVVVACLYGGAKHGGSISYPKTDNEIAYLTDAGSYVTNDAVHVAFTRLPMVPSSATFYLDYCALDGTNAQGVATNWVNAKTATFADLEVPFDFTFAAATNYNWMAYTDWTPGPAVQTNGVWHAYWGVDKKTGSYIIPVRTCVRADGEVIATPKSKWDAKDPMELTEAEAYERYAPDTAVVIDLDLLGTNTVTFTSVASSSTVGWGDYFTLDWGDGEKTTKQSAYWGHDLTHTYAKASGRYVVRVSNGAYGAFAVPSSTRNGVVRLLRWGDSGRLGSCASCPNLTAFPDGKLARWPAAATSIDSVYAFCSALSPSELPAWPAAATSIRWTYRNCDALDVAELPAWPEGATTIQAVFFNCAKFNVATLPEWPKGLTNASLAKEYYGMMVYYGCTSLAATNVPAWPAGLVDARDCYNRCTSLAATSLPAWPTTLTQANSTFYNCTSLAATNVPDWSVCANLTQANSTFQNCTSLAATALPAWPTTLTQANSTFQNCTSLAATALPAWPTTLTQANYTYYSCKNLTGAWTDDPDELMPTNITSHGNCVSGTSDALRALFYSDWGGSRTKTE